MEEYQEIWKPIKGYKNLYKISNKGSILSIKRNIVLSPLIDKGTIYVSLSKNGKVKKHYIRTLIKNHFPGIPKNISIFDIIGKEELQIIYIDKIKSSIRNFRPKYGNEKAKAKAIIMNYGTSRILSLVITKKYPIPELSNLLIFIDDKLPNYDFRLLY